MQRVTVSSRSRISAAPEGGSGVSQTVLHGPVVERVPFEMVRVEALGCRHGGQR